jgi:hypothetical protein
VFDLDGTLVDTRRAVVEAYGAAGVKFPAFAWGLPWRAWLPGLYGEERAAELHAKKTEFYPEMLLNHAEKLPAALVFCQLVAEGVSVGILTGASCSSARAALEICEISQRHLLGWEKDYIGKGVVLKYLKQAQNSVVYVDDDTNMKLVCSIGDINFVECRSSVNIYREIKKWTG